MGRKIPGKKHHGTKDPIKQQRVRYESIKNKINCPPADVDDQPIPGNLQRIVQWKELDNQDFSKRKMKKLNIYKSWLFGKPSIDPGQINKTKQPVSSKSEKLYNQAKAVDEELVDEYNNLEYDNNQSVESSEKKNKKNKKKGDIQQILLNAGGKGKQQISASRKEKMKLRLDAKRKARSEKIKEREADKDHLVDIIQFGEVAHAPPVLKLPTKNQAKINHPKPGRRVLLLKKLLPNASQKKKVPAEERNRHEQNRLQAVQDYRKLKASKRKLQEK